MVGSEGTSRVIPFAALASGLVHASLYVALSTYGHRNVSAGVRSAEVQLVLPPTVEPPRAEPPPTPSEPPKPPPEEATPPKEPDPPMPDVLERVRLGNQDSPETETRTWLGASKVEEHRARTASVEQGAFTRAPGLPGEPSETMGPGEASAPATTKANEEQAETPRPTAPTRPPEESQPPTEPAPAKPPMPDAPTEEPKERAAEAEAAKALLATPRIGPSSFQPNVTRADAATPSAARAVDRPLKQALVSANENAEAFAVEAPAQAPTTERSPDRVPTPPVPAAPSPPAPASPARATMTAEQAMAMVRDLFLPRPAPAARSTPTPPTPPGGGGTTGQRPYQASDRDADPSSLDEVVDYKPGRPLAARGLEIKTVPPDLTTLSRRFTWTQNPVVRVRFGRDGRVVLAEFVSGQTAGSREWDSALLTAMYQWRAAGEELSRLPKDQPEAGVEVSFRILLRE